MAWDAGYTAEGEGEVVRKVVGKKGEGSWSEDLRSHLKGMTKRGSGGRQWCVQQRLRVVLTVTKVFHHPLFFFQLTVD